MATDIEFFEFGVSEKADDKIKQWWKEHADDIVKWETTNGGFFSTNKLIVEYRIK